MTKTSGNCFYIVNLYFPCHFVNAFGLAALSYRPSSLIWNLGTQRRSASKFIQKRQQHPSKYQSGITIRLEKIAFPDAVILFDTRRIEADVYAKPTQKNTHIVQMKPSYKCWKSLPGGLALTSKEYVIGTRGFFVHRMELLLLFFFIHLIATWSYQSKSVVSGQLVCKQRVKIVPLYFTKGRI